MGTGDENNIGTTWKVSLARVEDQNDVDNILVRFKHNVCQKEQHWTVKREERVKKEYQQDATIYMIHCQFQMLIIDYSLDMFRASLCPSSGEKTMCYCIWGIFAATRKDADISHVVFFGVLVCGLISWDVLCVCVCSRV